MAAKENGKVAALLPPEIKKAQVEVYRFDKKLGAIVTHTVGLAMPVARALLAGGATKSFRKSERGGPRDTVVVKLYTDSYVTDAEVKARLTEKSVAAVQ